MKLYEFERANGTGFNFVFEHNLLPGETIYIRMPAVSANKRGINDIGWLTDGSKETFRLWGSLAKNPFADNAIWQEIQENDEINKVTAFLKVENKDTVSRRIEMRAIFY